MKYDKINNFKIQRQPDEIYIKEINTCIDSSLKSTIKRFNKNRIKTIGSCSGVIGDHYDINSFRKKTPYEEFKPLADLEPFIHTEPVFHEYSDNGYKYTSEFYKINRKCTRVSVCHNEYKHEVRISLDYVSTEDINEPFYSFIIEYPQLMIIKNKCNNYEEYDAVVSKIITKLGDIIDDVVKIN